MSTNYLKEEHYEAAIGQRQIWTVGSSDGGVFGDRERAVQAARCTRACAALVRAASLANSLRWRLVSRMRGVDGQAIRPRYQPPLTFPLRTGPRNELPGGCTRLRLARVVCQNSIPGPDDGRAAG